MYCMRVLNVRALKRERDIIYFTKTLHRNFVFLNFKHELDSWMNKSEKGLRILLNEVYFVPFNGLTNFTYNQITNKY